MLLLKLQWVNVQRKEKKEYEAGAKSAMTKEKLQHLEELGFEGNTKNTIWNQRWCFEELETILGEYNGDFPIVARSKHGTWVNRQQRNCPTARTAHTKERKAKLQRLGFVPYYER